MLHLTFDSEIKLISMVTKWGNGFEEKKTTIAFNFAGVEKWKSFLIETRV